MGDVKPRMALLAAGATGVAVAAALAHGAVLDAASRTWPPFALVAGLLLVGVVAGEDGIFAAVASRLDRLPGGEWTLYVVAMALVAVVTAVLNLDTSVAFLTPVLVHTARRRGTGDQRLLYGCVFMSNAASLLLPGSNLTNLLVLSGEHISGSVFLSRMALPWVASVVTTAVVVAVAFREPRAQPAQRAGTRESVRIRGRLGSLGVAAAATVTLLLADPALPILGLGIGLVAIRMLQRRITVQQVTQRVDVAILGGVFLVAVGLGAAASVWTFPRRLMANAGSIASAAIGAVTAVIVNNLPAAVLLGSAAPAHPRSLLIGLDVGPNLAVTGSLSAAIWWQAARSVGARPSALRYSAVGAALVPLTIAAALAAGHATL
jgi:arsenical pump membrane protein